MVIQMHWEDHPPPHIHVIHAGNEVSFDLRAMAITRGRLRKRQERKLLEWTQLHIDALLANWERMERHESPCPISEEDAP